MTQVGGPERTGPSCALCGRIPAWPDSGILVLGEFICERCQSRIVRLRPSDRDYDRTVGRIRRFLETHGVFEGVR